MDKKLELIEVLKDQIAQLVIMSKIELDEKYVDVIINRWQQFTGKEAVHIETGKTYNEMKQERENDKTSE